MADNKKEILTEEVVNTNPVKQDEKGLNAVVKAKEVKESTNLTADQIEAFKLRKLNSINNRPYTARLERTAQTIMGLK